MQEAVKKLSPSNMRDALSEAVGAATARGMPRSKAAVSLRKAVDKFNVDATEVIVATPPPSPSVTQRNDRQSKHRRALLQQQHRRLRPW